MANGRSWLTLLRCFTLLCLAASSICAQLGGVGGPGFIVFGRVYLPNGKPASRVKVFLEMPSGLNRYLPTDDGGNYEFRGIDRGRYKVKAVNPDDAQQFSDPAESDSNRAYANRVQIDIYLRLPMHKTDASKIGTISVAEAAQDIPKPARQAYEQGLKLQKENKSDKALNSFNESLRLFPEYFQALTERGNLFMQQNKLAEAMADFVQALRLNEKYSPALRGLGYCQIQQKQFEPAVSNLEKAFSLEPTVPLTLLLLGYGNLSLNRYEEAEQCLQQALKLNAESAARAHVYLAEIFAHKQQFKEAANEIHAYLKANPNAADSAALKEMAAKWQAQSKAKP
jgi:tetratricopeptide (TPR) repeat protein